LFEILKRVTAVAAGGCGNGESNWLVFRLPGISFMERYSRNETGATRSFRLFAMKYSSGTSTGAVNIEIKLPAINAIASPWKIGSARIAHLAG
jgi:hypothetical protein